MLKVVITDNLFSDCDIEKRILEEYSLHVADDKLEIAVQKADALLVNMAPIDAGLIEKMQRCLIISRYGSGYDNVDLKAASAAGICVATVPDYCSWEVAEHALALMLSCSRTLPARDSIVRNGLWRTSSSLGMPRVLRESVVGILGYGHTGQAFHRVLTGFRPARTLVCRKTPFAPSFTLHDSQTEFVSFEQLLEESDYLSIHLPLTKETLHLFNHDTLALMKKGSVLVNTSRGAIIDEEALHETLHRGPLSWAALDVLEEEPPRPENPLLQTPNLLLSDHQAFSSPQSIRLLRQKTAKNVRSFFETGQPVHSVNSPFIPLSQEKVETHAHPRHFQPAQS